MILTACRKLCPDLQPICGGFGLPYLAPQEQASRAASDLVHVCGGACGSAGRSEVSSEMLVPRMIFIAFTASLLRVRPCNTRGVCVPFLQVGCWESDPTIPYFMTPNKVRRQATLRLPEEHMAR
jgi:hypothetical protein